MLACQFPESKGKHLLTFGPYHTIHRVTESNNGTHLNDRDHNGNEKHDADWDHKSLAKLACV